MSELHDRKKHGVARVLRHADAAAMPRRDIRREKMKKILCAAAIALAAFVGMTGCDNPSDTKAADETAVTYSKWWIKGSFDGWKSDPKHFLEVNEIDATKITYKLSGLFANTSYEFVLVEPDAAQDQGEWRAPSDVALVDDTVTTFVASTGSVGPDKNARFIPTSSSYTIEVDITSATAPKVTMKPGTEAPLPITADVVAEKLAINFWGDGLDIVPDSVPVVNATDYTVTFSVRTTKPTHSFGFNSLNGYLKGAGNLSDTYVDLQYDQGEGCILNTATAIAVGAEYDITVKMPFAAGVFAGPPDVKYQIKAVKTKDGVAFDLAISDVCEAVNLRGAQGYFDELTSSYSGESTGTKTVTDNVITYTVTGSDVTNGGFAIVYDGTWYKINGGIDLATDYTLVITGMDNTLITGMVDGSTYNIIVTVPAKTGDATKYAPDGAWSLRVVAAAP
jgi:hypothetical protein